ncbi:hypothetical protein L208DRAFT_586157 [Tricholoma matsutake]|nr:hypothetical protein L208DRAFT_586157 [Tricholoma matsutake 945]
MFQPTPSFSGRFRDTLRNLVDEQSLSPVEALSESPPVDLWPRSPSSKVDPIDELTERLTFAHLETAQNDVMKHALLASSPSSTAALNGFLHEQEKHPIWDGRPSMNRGIPIQLYHPLFANFLRVDHEDTGEIELNPEDYSATHSLFLHSAALYKEEAKCIEATDVYTLRDLFLGIDATASLSPPLC